MCSFRLASSPNVYSHEKQDNTGKWRGSQIRQVPPRKPETHHNSQSKHCKTLNLNTEVHPQPSDASLAHEPMSTRAQEPSAPRCSLRRTHPQNSRGYSLTP